MTKNKKMDWSQIKLLSVIIVAIFTAIGGYALYKENQKSKENDQNYKDDATKNRKEINQNFEKSKEGLTKVELALENLDYIGMKKVQELKERYPYGYVLFGKLDNEILTNGSSINDNSINFSSDWEKAQIVYDAKNDPYHWYLTLYNTFHSNHNNKTSPEFKGFHAPKTKVNVPLYKEQTPVDITFIKYYNEPHMYFEILENYDGKNMVFLLGFKKNEEYDKNFKKENPEIQKGEITNPEEVKMNFEWNKKKFPENYKDKELTLIKEIEIDLNEILIEEGKKLREKYPYGFILFGNIHDKYIVGNRINDDSMLYDANWQNISLRPAGELGKTNSFILNIPNLIQKGLPDKATNNSPSICIGLLEAIVPMEKKYTPIDITLVKTIDHPNLYFEILREYDGKNIVFLIGAKKDKKYDDDLNHPSIKIGD